MTMRKRFRDLLAAPRLAVLPGAYDALSARIIERVGFDAILAGGYAASGSLLAQADMGQSNMRDYADHDARICAAVDTPGVRRSASRSTTRWSGLPSRRSASKATMARPQR